MEIAHAEFQNGGSFHVGPSHADPTAEMTYRRNGRVMVIDHTWVDESLRGQGCARKLFDEALAFAREQELKIIPICPYARAQFEEDESTHDVLLELPPKRE